MIFLGAKLKSTTKLFTEGRLTLLWLLFITILGAGLRFYNLGAKSLVPDEIYTATFSAKGLWYIWQNGQGNPLLYLITHFVLLLLRGSEFILRMPSALEGILGIVVLYKVGEALYGKGEGLLSALLLALSAYHLHYSQDLRFYPMLVLLSLLTLLFLWKALQEGKRRFWLGFVLATVANLYNHAFAWFVLASEMTFAALVILYESLLSSENRTFSLLKRAWGAVRPLFLPVVLFALIVILYLPTVSPFLTAFSSRGIVGAKLVTSGAPTEAKTALTWETLSPSFFAERIFGPFGAGTGVALVLYGAASLLGLARSRPKQIVLLLLWIGLPFVILPIVGVGRFYPRYVLYVLPVYLLLVSRGLAALDEIFGRLIEYLPHTSSAGKALLLGLVVGLFASLNLPPILNHYRRRDVDWQEVADHLMTNVKAGHWILCDGDTAIGWNTVYCARGLSYYLERAFQDNHPLASDKDMGSRIRAAATENYGIWIVVRHTAPLNPDVVQRLQAEGALTSFHFATVVQVDQGEGLVENAVTALQTLIELQLRPEARFDLYLSLAEIYAWQGDLERAQQALAAAKEVQPHHYNARVRMERVSGGLQAVYHLGLGDAYLADGKAQEAAQEYERALALNATLEEKAWFHLGLGDAYLADGKAQEAAQEYERALALNAKARFHLGLGDAYLADGKAQEAAQEYERALALNASLEEKGCFHLHLGRAYREAGRLGEAIREYERVLELKPENAAAQEALASLR